MRSVLPPEIAPIVTFAYWTGCRKSEILTSQWRHVDLLQRIVRFDPGTTKNDDPRVVPLADDLHVILTLQRLFRDERFPNCPWVFFREGEPIRDFRGAWAKACEQIGLIDDHGEASALFHDLRRTGLRNLVRAGAPERAAISGHRTRAVFNRYNIISEADLRDAARKLSAHIAAQEPGRHTIGTQAAQMDKPDIN